MWFGRPLNRFAYGYAQACGSEVRFSTPAFGPGAYSQG